MIYSNIPQTPIVVSKICLGTMTFGEQNTEAEAWNQLDYALDHGVNFLDTAELYAVPSTKENNGKTEEYIGTWIRHTKKRDKYIIATKVAGPAANRSYISPNLGFSKERIHHAINRSLTRLKTDYVDLYQLHWPERNVNSFGKLEYVHQPDEKWQDNIATVAEIMNGLVKDGKVKYWGLSNETPWGVMRFLQACDLAGIARPVTIQNPYNLLNRSYEIGLAEISHREDVGLLAYSPLAMGVLTGKYNNGTASPDDRLHKYTYFSRYASDLAKEVTAHYLALANDLSISLTQLALSYVNQAPFVTSNIIGATNLAQLKENIDSINYILTPQVKEKIDRIHRRYSNPAP